MSYLHTMQTIYEKMRSADVTTDDTAFDGETSGARYTDITTRDIYEFGPEVNGAEIMFTGEATAGRSFSCEVWGVTLGGLGEFMCDLSGLAGTAWADLTDADSSARLFIDSLTIIEEEHVKDITVADSGNNRYAKLGFDTLGYGGAYCRFTVGDATEVSRITPWIRTW